MATNFAYFKFLFNSPNHPFLPNVHMASIFTRALRTQARITLVASKARVVPSMPTFFGLASRRALPSFSARSLSTSQVLRDYDDVREPLQPSETLYLGNLPFAAGKEDLQALLGDFGNIKAIRMGLSLFFFPLHFWACPSLQATRFVVA